jgi:hypothetical protein
VTERIQRAADLRAAGYDKNEVRRMVRAGVLTRLCRGAYITSEPNDVGARHRLLVRAVLAELALGAVASHVSAAVLPGLPTWGLRLDRVHVTFARRSGGRRDDRLYVHRAPLEPDEVVVIDGVLVTTAARAVVDIVRTVGFEPAVAVADAALRLDTARRRDGSSTVLPRWPESGGLPWRGAAGRAELDAALRRATGWPGVPAARRVVAFADGQAESVGESRSRVAIARAGLPAPELQWPVPLAGYTAYTDFGWPKQRTVGEFDGRIKYGRLLKPGQDPGEVVYAEKVREDAVRAEDLGVVRWTWADLDHFAATAAHIRARFRD